MSRTGGDNLLLEPTGSASWQHPPSPDLADTVVKVWQASWDHAPEEDVRVRILTDASVHFVAEVGNSRVVGVVTGVFTRKLEGRGCVVGVKLQPGALRRFTDLPASEWTDEQGPLDALFPDEVPALEDMVARTSDPGELQAQMEAFLRRHQRPVDSILKLVQSTVRALEHDPEINRVDRLCEVVGVSRKRLGRAFSDAVGVSPKWFMRRHRLLEAAQRLRAGEAIALTELAHELGYFDQAHFHRDFRDTVGESPSAFAAG